MNVAIYAPTESRVFDGNTMMTTALGGIESSIVMLGRELGKYYNTYIFNRYYGDCVFDGVRYLYYDKIDKFDIDVVIVVSYEGSVLDNKIYHIPS
jgi:hypothetical protein